MVCNTIDNGMRVALVIGATGAIVKAVARWMAKIEGHEAVVRCRNEQKGREAVQDLMRARVN
jgi:NAD(P)-dependent dehydrogenase (short-subunit alcohol dehydrogenase family)